MAMVAAVAGCGTSAVATRRTAGAAGLVGVPPPPPSAARGSRPLDWGLVRVWLPAAWTPSPSDRRCRTSGFTELQSRVGIGLAPCDDPGGAPALTITRFVRPAPSGGRHTEIDGIPVVTYRWDGQDRGRVVVPSLAAELVARNASAAPVIATLQRSLGDDFVHARVGNHWPARWRTVTFRGLSLSTPPRWSRPPIGYLPCGELGQQQPAVLRASADSVSGCAGYPSFVPVPTTMGAAWVDPGPDPAPTVGPAVTDHRGPLTLSWQVVADTPAQVVVGVAGAAHGTVELAIPTDPATLAAVAASIR